MTADDARQHGLTALEHQERFDSRLAAIDDREGFDATFGVETRLPVETWEMEEADDAALRSHARYSPTPVRTIRRVIGACPIRHEDVSFVDFGAGKGRVMLVASDYPFKRIAGVEFSGSLCETARENCRRYRSDAQRCRAFEVHHRDAREFPVPDDAGVFYFYEPFSAAIAERVLENIESSLRRQPRRAVLCLVGRGLRDVIERRPGWRRAGAAVASPDDPYYDATLYANDV
jgi:hypothetical protein